MLRVTWVLCAGADNRHIVGKGISRMDAFCRLTRLERMDVTLYTVKVIEESCPGLLDKLSEPVTLGHP